MQVGLQFAAGARAVPQPDFVEDALERVLGCAQKQDWFGGRLLGICRQVNLVTQVAADVKPERGAVEGDGHVVPGVGREHAFGRVRVALPAGEIHAQAGLGHHEQRQSAGIRAAFGAGQQHLRLGALGLSGENPAFEGEFFAGRHAFRECDVVGWFI